ncbi:MAG: TadE/TadG family protein [Sphingomonas sp.]|nr:TadE/TadG family protein [Sphingomonas sp.]
MARINEREIRNHPKGLHEKGQRGFLARLRDDTRGNVLAIATAAIIPLLCLIGSGIDLSRAYAAQSRLQVACDAAALAGRRAMSDGEVDDTVRTEARKFFNFNFPQHSFQTADFTPNITNAGTEGASKTTVVVTAATTIPTSIMKIFGFGNLPISVTCNAKQDFVNTDIMLVLDTTGSMNDALGGSKKIDALRDAVLALYDELAPVQDQLEKVGLRLRYGIVPYSSNVNVGKLVYALDSSYIQSGTWNYQSRTNPVSTSSTMNKESDCTAKEGSWKSSTKTCEYYNWTYKSVSQNISSFVAGSTVDVPTRKPGTTWTSSWQGCIEERQTTSSIVASSDLTIPNTAYDLDLAKIPTSDSATKWKPFWPEVSYLRNGTSLYDRSSDRAWVACPTEARRLTSWTRQNLDTYLKSLVPVGGTYHDIGMIWGGRMLSRDGIFSDDNPATYKNMPVSRFLIFMTDDAIAPNADSYSAYGVEQLDQRVTGSSSASNQTARHEQRFKMACNATKKQGVSIWVISFHATLDPSTALKECASTSSQVSKSTNRDQLIAKFVEIGKNIGSLRLTQ